MEPQELWFWGPKATSNQGEDVYHKAIRPDLPLRNNDGGASAVEDNTPQAAGGGARGAERRTRAGLRPDDAEVIAAADEYKMVMAFSGLRLFHH